MMNLPEYPHPADNHARNDVESGVYEKHYHFNPGDVVIDFGAHIGFFTEWVLPKIQPGGKVVAIEPHPRNFHELQLRCKGVEAAILINAAALDTVDCTVELHNNINNSGGHQVFCEGGPPFLFSIKVPTIDTGRFLIEKKMTGINFAKIDTEGSENVILTNLFRNLIFPNAMAVECHSTILLGFCQELLKSKGYETIQEQWMLYAERLI